MALGTWRNMIYAVTPISARTVRMTELLERAKTGAGPGLSTQGEKE
jgi:hypothetical protein